MSQVNVNKVISPNQALSNGPSIDIAGNGNISLDTNTVFVDSANDRFGVNTTTPNRTIDLSGTRGASFSGGIIFEKCNITGSGLTGTVNHDLQTANVYHWNLAATGNWTYNVRYSATATLDSQLLTGQIANVIVVTPVGASSFYHTAFQIDGVAQTVEWNEAQAPTQAGSNDFIATTGYDVYSFQIHKTGSATYTVLGAQTHFGSFT